MIDYGRKVGKPDWHMLFQIRGSVFPRCCLYALPFSLLAVALKILNNQVAEDDVAESWTSMHFLNDMSSWGGLSGLVNFVVVFRLSNAYSTYWAAYNTTNGFLGDWSGAAASTVTFARAAKKDTTAFLHTVIRLFSMLSACALQELSPRMSHKVWGLYALDCSAFDDKSLALLDGSELRVDMCYHWIQQLIIDNMGPEGALAAPPPIIGRSLTELSAGMAKFGDAKKHANCQFNFPYAQAAKWLLIVYTTIMPFMMVRWAKWVAGAFLFTFVQLIFVWALNEITLILEAPFDTANGDNCINVLDLQHGMNNALLLLMNPKVRQGPPTLSAPMLSANFDQLQDRDTVHRSALKNEGWQLAKQNSKTLADQDDIEMGKGCCHGCCRGCGKNAATEYSVSKRYCTKRYAIIDEEKTAVVPVGIVGSELIVAVPMSCQNNNGSKAVVKVCTVTGQFIKVLAKKIAISDRHKLHKEIPKKWSEGNFRDFSNDCKELTVHFHSVNVDALLSSKVTLQADITARQRIEEAKDADKSGHGIDKMVQLKKLDVFCKELQDVCGFDRKQAEDEWQRRKRLPAQYDQGRDDEHYLMIELDVHAFKKELEQKEKEEKKQREQLEKAFLDLLESSRLGGIKDLDASIRAAIMDTAGYSKEHVDEKRQMFHEWKARDEALRDAIANRDTQALEKALHAASSCQQIPSYKEGQKVISELLSEEGRRRLEASKESGIFEDLERDISDLEAALGQTTLKTELASAKKLLNDWRKAEEDLQKATDLYDEAKLLAAIDAADAVQLRGDRYNRAQKYVKLKRQDPIRAELRAAVELGRTASLQATLDKAVREGLPEAELSEARRILADSPSPVHAALLSDAVVPPVGEPVSLPGGLPGSVDAHSDAAAS